MCWVFGKALLYDFVHGVGAIGPSYAELVLAGSFFDLCFVGAVECCLLV